MEVKSFLQKTSRAKLDSSLLIVNPLETHVTGVRRGVNVELGSVRE